MPKKVTAKKIKTKKRVLPTPSISGSQFIADCNNIFDVLLSYAIELEAKELHFEWQETKLKLRWRLGGKLTELFNFDSEQTRLLKEQIVKRFAIEQDNKLPFQEKTISYKFESRFYFLSLSVMSIIGGDRFFLRIEKSEKYDLSRLEFNKVQKQCLDDLFNSAEGIVIVGAVKTANRQKQLKALVGQYKSPKQKAVLISEQPIYDWNEGDILAVKPEIGFTRRVAIKAAMQADYDFVLIDILTATEELELVLELAGQGKKILIGLPWSSPSKNFHYLWQLSGDKSLLRKFIQGMSVEFSLPRLCKHCRIAQKLSLQGKAAIASAFVELPEAVTKKLNLHNISEQKFYHAKGCFFCQETGYHGYEYSSSVVKFKKPGREILTKFYFNDLLLKQGFISARQVAIIKASEGRVDLLDALAFPY